jgi:hypothetical protein
MVDTQKILSEFSKIKNQFKNIVPEMEQHTKKIETLSARAEMFNKNYESVNKQTQKIYVMLRASLDKAGIKLSRIRAGYTGISSTMPHAKYISEKILKVSPKGSAGLAFNMAPVIAVTAASGMVLAAIYGLGEILDPVERNINTQSVLLDQVMAGTMSASQFTAASDAALADLNNQDYDIQQTVGFNPWIVLITSGAIYGGYKIMENTNMIKQIKGTFNDIKNYIGGKRK